MCEWKVEILLLIRSEQSTSMQWSKPAGYKDQGGGETEGWGDSVFLLLLFDWNLKLPELVFPFRPLTFLCPIESVLGWWVGKRGCDQLSQITCVHHFTPSYPIFAASNYWLVEEGGEGAIRINLTSSPVIAELATVVFPHLWLHDLLYTEYSTPVVVLTIIQSI